MERRGERGPGGRRPRSRPGPPCSRRRPSCSRTKYRSMLNAATMLGQSKTAYQAEIDSACELIDFLRFNVAFAHRHPRRAAVERAGDVGTSQEPRPLEGFVFAVTPFNFTAIAGNLPAAPALMGNTVVWKPAETRCLSAHYIDAAPPRGAGLPPASSTWCTARRRSIADARACATGARGRAFHRDRPMCFAGCGRRSARASPVTATFPRLVGETGGKEFVFAHPSADVEALGGGARARRLRVPGAKVLGGVAGLRPARRFTPRCRERVVALIARDSHGRRRRFSQLHGRRHRRAGAFEQISGYIELARI